jgi:hypothetical protein
MGSSGPDWSLTVGREHVCACAWCGARVGLRVTLSPDSQPHVVPKCQPITMFSTYRKRGKAGTTLSLGMMI